MNQIMKEKKTPKKGIIFLLTYRYINDERKIPWHTNGERERERE